MKDECCGGDERGILGVLVWDFFEAICYLHADTPAVDGALYNSGDVELAFLRIRLRGHQPVHFSAGP